ncbi:hypothetical protein XU18_4403 [Perkinsela sp. CCAP 1560/4]|nr:hypothetical protein XU18_4403 [Perkinsela sp. CCAP 1560/4]|eukprot:KNH04313.1 hypothetical protein XU18_4403 [Perkinsela sp. CCAP 1560/4]
MLDLPPCIVINPGHYPVSQFEKVDHQKWTCDVGTILSEKIAAALTDPNCLTQGTAIALFLRTTGENCWTSKIPSFSSEFMYIGCLSHRSPAGVFDVPITLLQSSTAVNGTLGVSIEPQGVVDNLSHGSNKPASTIMQLAMKLANDLISHISSYPSSFCEGQEVICFPVSSISKWLDRVKQRLK